MMSRGQKNSFQVHMNLIIARAARAGIWQAGGTPFEFNSAAQCPMAVGKHGMRYDLPTRDIIAAEVEAIAHLLALSYELGWERDIDLNLIERLSDEIPCITNVAPIGRFTMQDFDDAGGIQAVMKRIEPTLDTQVLTASGRTVKEQLETVTVPQTEVIKTLENPIARDSLVILRGNLARSSVVRTPVIPKEMLRHKGPARIFHSQEDALQALREHRIKRGDVLILRYEGPKGGPGFNEVFKVIGYLNASGLESDCALITDGRISGFGIAPRTESAASDPGPAPA